MAAPTRFTVDGAPYGFNGKITHATLGTLYICVGAIQRNVSINTSEASASQAKTMYPLWVSQGSVVLRLLHRDHAARNKVANWIKRFMEDSSRARLSQNYLDFMVPVHRFTRRAVPQGTLTYGEAFDDGMLTTMLTLTGAADPVRRYTDRSRMQFARNDALVSTYFYPAGVQTGWDPADEVYQQPPPQRPGQPRTAV